MKVWIVKYALTKGLFEIEGKEFGVDGISQESTNWPTHYHGEGIEWCRTKEEAVQVAEKMRQKKIASLERQIEKLKKMKF